MRPLSGRREKGSFLPDSALYLPDVPPLGREGWGPASLGSGRLTFAMATL